jgi:UDP-N-acetyl-D-mannosaminuronic acid dehydrogenase
MPFYEAGAEDALLQITNKNLSATTSNEGIANSDVCILIIGTPVNNDGVPSAGHIGGLVKELSIHLQATKLIMLRSTVYPGITEQIQVIAQELFKFLSVPRE